MVIEYFGSLRGKVATLAVSVASLALSAAIIKNGSVSAQETKQILENSGIPTETPNPKEVKIGETVVIFPGESQFVDIKNATKLETIGDRLEYLKKYFSASEVEWEILKKSPTSRVVCEFADTFMRIEKNLRSLEVVWKYLDENEQKIEGELKQVVAEILKATNKSKNEVDNILSKPALTGTYCGIVFNLAYATQSSEKIASMQNLTRNFLVKLSEFLRRRIEEGDEEAENVSETLIDLIFDRLPEQNR